MSALRSISLVAIAQHDICGVRARAPKEAGFVVTSWGRSGGFTTDWREIRECGKTEDGYGMVLDPLKEGRRELVGVAHSNHIPQPRQNRDGLCDGIREGIRNGGPASNEALGTSAHVSHPRVSTDNSKRRSTCYF